MYTVSDYYTEVATYLENTLQVGARRLLVCILVYSHGETRDMSSIDGETSDMSTVHDCFFH